MHVWSPTWADAWLPSRTHESAPGPDELRVPAGPQFLSLRRPHERNRMRSAPACSRLMAAASAAGSTTAPKRLFLEPSPQQPRPAKQRQEIQVLPDLPEG